MNAKFGCNNQRQRVLFHFLAPRSSAEFFVTALAGLKFYFDAALRQRRSTPLLLARFFALLFLIASDPLHVSSIGNLPSPLAIVHQIPANTAESGSDTYSFRVTSRTVAP